MKTFTCSCKWKYVITNKWVFGPIFLSEWEEKLGFPVDTANTANVMSKEDFAEQYGDCYRNWTHSH